MGAKRSASLTTTYQTRKARKVRMGNGRVQVMDSVRRRSCNLFPAPVVPFDAHLPMRSQHSAMPPTSLQTRLWCRLLQLLRLTSRVPDGHEYPPAQTCNCKVSVLPRRLTDTLLCADNTCCKGEDCVSGTCKPPCDPATPRCADGNCCALSGLLSGRGQCKPCDAATPRCADGNCCATADCINGQCKPCDAATPRCADGNCCASADCINGQCKPCDRKPRLAARMKLLRHR